MKNINFTQTVILILVLAFTSGCGKRADTINVGPDGYGKMMLSNGMTILVNHDETTSLTSARLLIGGGILTESAENNGITNLMVKMFLKGNNAMTASEMTEKLDFYGANVSADCYRDYSAVSFTCLTENFAKVYEILIASFKSPTFPEEELTKLKHEVEGRIKAADDNQSRASSKLFWKTAFGNRGYGLATLGTMESIANITVDELRKHFQKYVGGSNMIFSIATDLSADKISAIINSQLADIKPDAQSVPVPASTLQDEKNGFKSFDRNQSFIFTGYIFDHLQPNEVPYVILLNEVMGGNIGSRLWFLRQKEKLAYSVYTQYTTDKFGSIFRAAIGTDTSKVNLALESLKRELDKLIADGITEEELTDARINMKNNLIYRIDRKGSRANYMAYYEYVDYNYRFVLDLIDMADKITRDEINSFVKANFTDDNKFTSIVGKK